MEYFRSGTQWEPIVGYSRAVKVGQTIHVSGTTATDEQGQIVGIDDVYVQTQQCLKNIERALLYFDCDLQSVYRTRIYVTNIDHWQDVGRAHAEVFFDNHAPASSMVQVQRLINEALLVEIEAEAYWEF